MEQTESELIEAWVFFLSDLTEKIRTGKIKVTNFEQRRPFERWFKNREILEIVKEHAKEPILKDRKVKLSDWQPVPNQEFFSIGDCSITLNYHYPDQQQAEISKKQAFIDANPYSEFGGTYPWK